MAEKFGKQNEMRLIYMGTPVFRGSDNPLERISKNIINKAGVELCLQPFSASEYFALIRQTIGQISGKELVALWAITGGNARKLRTFLETCPPR